MAKKGSLFLANAVVLSLLGGVTPVAAEERTTNIGYVVDQAYEWSIPSQIVFTANSNADTKSFPVTVSKNIIGYGKYLHISLASDSAFTISDVNSPGNQRQYEVKNGNTVYSKGQDVLKVASGVNSGSSMLSFMLQPVAVQKAGTYRGMVNFVSSVS